MSLKIKFTDLLALVNNDECSAICDLVLAWCEENEPSVQYFHQISVPVCNFVSNQFGCGDFFDHEDRYPTLDTLTRAFPRQTYNFISETEPFSFDRMKYLRMMAGYNLMLEIEPILN